RWVFLSAELPPDFYARPEAARLIAALAETAQQGSEEFTVRPTLPLYLQTEPIELELGWYAATGPAAPLKARINVSAESEPGKSYSITVDVPTSQLIPIPAPHARGLHVIHAELLEGNKIRAVYRSAFWIRDMDYLNSGTRLGANRDYFEWD